MEDAEFKWKAEKAFALMTEKGLSKKTHTVHFPAALVDGYRNPPRAICQFWQQLMHLGVIMPLMMNAISGFLAGPLVE